MSIVRCDFWRCFSSLDTRKVKAQFDWSFLHFHLCMREVISTHKEALNDLLRDQNLTRCTFATSDHVRGTLYERVTMQSISFVSTWFACWWHTHKYTLTQFVCALNGGCHLVFPSHHPKRRRKKSCPKKWSLYSCTVARVQLVHVSRLAFVVLFVRQRSRERRNQWCENLWWPFVSLLPGA